MPVANLALTTGMTKMICCCTKKATVKATMYPNSFPVVTNVMIFTINIGEFPKSLFYKGRVRKCKSRKMNETAYDIINYFVCVLFTFKKRRSLYTPNARRIYRTDQDKRVFNFCCKYATHIKIISSKTTIISS